MLFKVLFSVISSGVEKYAKYRVHFDFAQCDRDFFIFLKAFYIQKIPSLFNTEN